MAANKDQGVKSPSTEEPSSVEKHVRELLQKLTAHVKQKSVGSARPIKADREEHRPRGVAYL
jgi:hypothetical protein